MKNMLKLCGIISLIMIIGFSLIGCDTLSGNDDKNGSTGGPGSSSSRAIELTYNTWLNANIPESGNDPRERWFKFTATANNQNIYFRGSGWHMSLAFGGLWVQLYDNNLNTIGSEALCHNGQSISRAVTNGYMYYIKIRPFSIYGGDFQIGFTDFPALPGTVFNQLNENTWMNGYIPSSDSGASQEQWFRFTANGNPQYIHAGFNTLTSFWIQLYDSNFFVVGSTTSLNNSTQYTSRVVSIGSIYYLKVSSGNSGTYRIGFNTSTSEPFN